MKRLNLLFKGQQILTSSFSLNKSIAIYDFNTGMLLDKIIPVNKQENMNGDFYYTAKFYKSGHVNYILVGGSGSSALEIINRKEMKVRMQFKSTKAVTCMDSIHNFAVFSGMENCIRICRLNLY